MSRARFRPVRRLRSEILPLLSVVLLAGALFELFPRQWDAFRLGPRVRDAARSARPEAGCAFVTLTPAQEEAALAAARTSWQSGNVAVRRRIEMLPAALPEIPFSPAVDRPARAFAPSVLRLRPRARLLPPTEAAPRPARLARQKADGPRPAFSREVMLQLQ